MKRKYNLNGLFTVAMGLILFVPTEIVTFFNTGIFFAALAQGALVIAIGFVFFGLYNLFNYNKNFSIARNSAIILGVVTVLNTAFLIIDDYTEVTSTLALLLSVLIILLGGLVTLFTVKGCGSIATECGSEEQAILSMKTWKIYLCVFLIIFVARIAGFFLLSAISSLGIILIIISGAFAIGINIVMVIRILETYKRFNEKEM